MVFVTAAFISSLCLLTFQAGNVVGGPQELPAWFEPDSYDGLEGDYSPYQLSKKSDPDNLNYPKNPERFRRLFCIQPHWSCQSNPEGCCEDYTCRCNLFGTNCRCMRLGIFQRFG